MGSLKNMTISIGFDDKTTRKLKAISKHVGALADELEAIDNSWECPNCGESNYDDYFAGERFIHRVCNACNILYDGQDITADELPTQREGSE